MLCQFVIGLQFQGLSIELIKIYLIGRNVSIFENRKKGKSLHPIARIRWPPWQCWTSASRRRRWSSGSSASQTSSTVLPGLF